MSHNLFNSLRQFQFGAGKSGKYYSLPALEQAFRTWLAAQ